MAHLKFTSVLSRYFPDLKETRIEGNSILQIIEQLNKQHPGIINYILDDQKMLRKHVNIFVNGSILPDRNDLNKKIDEHSEVYIIQALSGG